MGRRAHIGENKFDEFLQSIPDESKGQGLWRVKKENIQASGGGIVHSYMGFLDFNPAEGYEGLKIRIKNTFAEKSGPGVYYAVPCDDRKHELKGVDMVKVEFTEKEVPVPAPSEVNNGGSGMDPLKDVMNMVKKSQKDSMEIQAMKAQSKLLRQMAGDDEEDDVKESPGMMGGGLENIMLYKSLFGDDKKKEDTSELKASLAKIEAKMEAQSTPRNGNSEMSEIKDLLKDMIRNQQNPPQKGDSEVRELLKHLVEKDGQKEKESTLQTMFAMQVKAQEERDRARDADMKADRDRREAEEKRKEEERKEERRRYDEDRKEERKQAEVKAAQDFERFKAELAERDRKFTAEMELRKQELNAAKEGSKNSLSDQQQMQLKFFELMKNGKDSNFEMMKDVFGIMSSSGLNSMKTAQEAANAIISITERMKDSDSGDDKPSGLESIMKGLGAIAGPLIAPYANMDAMARMVGGGGAPQGPSIPGLPPGIDINQILATLQQAGVRPPVQAAPKAPNQVPVAGMSPAPKGQKMEGAAAMISQFLSRYPEVKFALLGNLEGGLGVKLFLPIILDVNQPALEALIANIPSNVLMNAVKSVCSAQEKALVDANKAWFEDLKKAMIEELKADAEGEDEDEDEIDEDEDGEDEAAPAAPPARPAVIVPPAPPAPEAQAKA